MCHVAFIPFWALRLPEAGSGEGAGGRAIALAGNLSGLRQKISVLKPPVETWEAFPPKQKGTVPFTSGNVRV